MLSDALSSMELKKTICITSTSSMVLSETKIDSFSDCDVGGSDA
jgi:hypothetical protein